MTTFVQTDEALVNLASVVRIEPRGQSEIQFVTEEDLHNEVYLIGGSVQASMDFASENTRNLALIRLTDAIKKRHTGDRIIDPRALVK